MTLSRLLLTVGPFQVELVNDSLYEWNVKIMRVDPDSSLAEDLRKLKEREGKDHILLSFIFKVGENWSSRGKIFSPLSRALSYFRRTPFLSTHLLSGWFTPSSTEATFSTAAPSVWSSSLPRAGRRPTPLRP